MFLQVAARELLLHQAESRSWLFGIHKEMTMTNREKLARNLGTITRYLQGGGVTKADFREAIECAQGLYVGYLDRWARADKVLPPLGFEVLAVKGKRKFIAHRLKDGWHDESGKMVTPDYWQVVAMPDEL